MVEVILLFAVTPLLVLSLGLKIVSKLQEKHKLTTNGSAINRTLSRAETHDIT